MSKEHEFDIPADLNENEQWLARFDTPKPSDDVIGRIKANIRRELAEQGLAQHPKDTEPEPRTYRLVAVLAAAAMLTIGLGLFHLATQQAETQIAADEQMATADVFVASLDTVLDQQDDEIALLGEQIAMYEQGWTIGGALESTEDEPSVGDLLDELMDVRTMTIEG